MLVPRQKGGGLMGQARRHSHREARRLAITATQADERQLPAVQGWRGGPSTQDAGDHEQVYRFGAQDGGSSVGGRRVGGKRGDEEEEATHGDR